MKKITIFAISIVMAVSTMVGQNTKTRKHHVKNGVYQGVIRVKFKKSAEAKADALHHKLKNTSLKSLNAVVNTNTGISRLNTLNKKFKADHMKRVFPYAGKHESKHRAFGLHLWYEIRFDSDTEISTLLSQYALVDEIDRSESIYEVKRISSVPPPPTINGTNDPKFSDQWHYKNTGQNGGTAGKDIKLLDAWKIETGNSNVIVAIEDGGIDVTHEDLVGNLWVNSDEIPGNGIDDDNNGYVDDIHGYNFVDKSGNVTPDSHGTHVAGTVAAETNNGIGVSGVAGGSGNNDGVRLMSCQVFTATGAGGFAEAYTYAADNGAVISQNSWGNKYVNVKSQAVLDAIDYFRQNAGGAGKAMSDGLVIFAAGNSNATGQWYPGCYANVLAVAATNNKDVRSYYSNYGDWVDISAPGGELISSNTDPKAVHSTLPNNNYGVMQGTSMACPHVSGVAALIVSQNYGNISAQQVWNRLVNNTDPIDQLNSSYAGKLGSGRLNAYKALNTAPPVKPTTPTNITTSEVTSTGFKISWDAVSGATLYKIQYRVNGVTAWTSLDVNTNSKTLSGLTSNTIYEFRIAASNSAGTSDYSATSSVTTLNFTYCDSKGKNATYEWISKVEIGDFTKSSGSAGYTNFTSENVIVEAGKTYAIKLTPAYKSTEYFEYWKIWADFNSNGSFTDANELIFDAGAKKKSVVSGNITIPASVEGSFRLRVSMKYDGAQTSCETFDYGEVEDYTLVVNKASVDATAPSVPAGLVSSDITKNSFKLTWDASTDNVAVTAYDIYKNSVLAGTTASTSYDLTGLSASTTYQMTVKAKDAAGNESDASTSLNVTTKSQSVNYCSSSGSNSTYEWIDLVNLGTINNVTTSNGGYGDFTSLSATIQRGATTKIYFSAGFKSTSYTEYWQVWIDLNQDGTFDNNEKLVSGSSSSANRLSADMAIPSSALLGETRMRVSMKFNSAATACETIRYGEVEDYTVVISDNAPAALSNELFTDVLEKNNGKSDYSIYPNPVKDKLNLNLDIHNAVDVSIYSTSGVLLISKKLNNEGEEIDVSELKEGSYIIIVNGERELLREQFIKK